VVALAAKLIVFPQTDKIHCFYW